MHPVVDGEHGGRDRAERDAQEDGVCRHREGLQVVGAADGRETEEYEHRRLSERRVGNGLRTAHVRIGGNDRGDADQREDPVADSLYSFTVSSSIFAPCSMESTPFSSATFTPSGDSVWAATG